nr:GLUG motif-containing protein [Halorutilus salinus]
MGTAETSGGLVGQNNGLVERSASAGTVRDPEGVSTGGSIAGGLVGNNTGTVNASKAIGEFDGDAGEAGGLVGINDGGTVRLSYADVDVTTGDTSSGGLVGRQYGGVIDRSYATGDVNGGGNLNIQSYVGGIVGAVSENAVVNKSYAVGDVQGTFRASPDEGGLVGSVSADSTVRNSYWDTGTTGQDSAVESGSVEGSVSEFSTGDGLGRANAMTGSDPPEAGNMSAFEYVETDDPNPSWLLTKGYPVLVWDNTDAVDTPFFATEVTDANTSVQQGETLEVEATVENIRGGEGIQTVKLVYDTDGSGFESGTTVADTRQVDGLVAGSSADVTFEDTVENGDFAGGDFDNLQVRLAVETENDIDLRTVDRDAEVEVAAVSSTGTTRNALKTALDNGLTDAGSLGEYLVTPETAANVTGADASAAADEYDVLVVNDFGGVLRGEGTTTTIPDTEIEDLYDEIDASSDTRIVSLDMGNGSFGTPVSNAVRKRADVLDDMDGVQTADDGTPPVQMRITDNHPLFKDVGSAGDTVNVYGPSITPEATEVPQPTPGLPAPRAWFVGYTGNSYANITESSSPGTDGSAAGVTTNGNEVLLSLGGVGGPVSLTNDGERILANSVLFSFDTNPSPSVPFFDVTIEDANSTVTEGDEVVVEYTVENTGEATDTQDIEFLIGGVTQDTKTGVELSGSEEVSGEFRYTTESGDAPEIDTEVSTENDSDTRTITVQQPDAEFTVDIIDTTVTDGEVLVDVDVTNVGDSSGTQTVEAKIDGELKDLALVNRHT